MGFCFDVHTLYPNLLFIHLQFPSYSLDISSTTHYENAASHPLKYVCIQLFYDTSGQLKEHRLSTSGGKDVLRRRLKAHLRSQKLKEQDDEMLTIQHNPYYDYYLVIDFEATCDDQQNQTTYR